MAARCRTCMPRRDAEQGDTKWQIQDFYKSGVNSWLVNGQFKAPRPARAERYLLPAETIRLAGWREAAHWRPSASLPSLVKLLPAPDRGGWPFLTTPPDRSSKRPSTRMGPLKSRISGRKTGNGVGTKLVP